MKSTNIQAGIGLAQLEQLDKAVEKKRYIGSRYSEKLKTIKSVQLPLKKTDYAENIYWVFGIVIKDNKGINADSAINFLKEKGIGTRPFFWPMHKQPVFIKMGL